MSSPLVVYGYIGVATFGALMAWRLLGVMLGAFDSIIPDVSDAPWPFWELRRIDAVAILLAACLVAWPFVGMVFFSAKRDSK